MVLLSDIMAGPFAGIIILAAGILIAFFAGFSQSRKINIIIASVTAASYAAAIYINIRNYLAAGPAATYLTNTGPAETIISAALLFCGLNVLFFLSLEKLSRRDYVRQVIMLSFAVVSVLLLAISDNIIFFTVSLIVTILSIFNFLASSGKDLPGVREYAGGFGLRPAAAAGFVLMGFSLLAGTGTMDSISSFTAPEKAGDPLFMIAVLFLGCAVYLFFFLYPFQGLLLGLSAKADVFSNQVLWLLYIPSGIVMLIKLETFFDMFYGRQNIYGFAVLALLAFLNLLGPGLASIRSFNIKRILSLFLLFQLGTLLLAKAADFTGRGPSYTAGIFDLWVLFIILTVFLPLSMFSRTLEMSGSRGMIDRSRGFFRSHPYAGICFVIIFIWWLAANIYLCFLNGPLPGALLMEQGTWAAVLYAGCAAALALMAANIIRMMLILFGRASENNPPAAASLPAVFYIYISFFALAAAVSAVLVFTGNAGTGQDSIQLWGSSFYIFGSGN
jgi:hypothetical protein